MARPVAAGPPLSPAQEKGHEPAGPKAESPCGGCPLFHGPARASPRWPGPPHPTQTGSCCRKPDTTGFVFWASPPPRRPLQPKARMPRPRSGRGQATARPRGRRRGARRSGHTKTHKGLFVELPVACSPARTHRVGTRDLEILLLKGVQGAQAGPPVLWLWAGLTKPPAGTVGWP